MESANVRKSVVGSVNRAEREHGHAIVTRSTKSLAQEGENRPVQVMESVIRPAVVMDRMLQLTMVTERAIRSLTVNESVIWLAIRFKTAMESIAIQLLIHPAAAMDKAAN